MTNPIPVFRPTVDADAIFRELRPVLESGWLGQGPKVEELEAKLAQEVNAKYFVATNSGTAALHLAVHCAAELFHADFVLTSPITFVSTNAALVWCDVRPVFGETRYGMLVDRDYGGAELNFTLSVSLGGQEPCPAIIQDCSHAFGASWLSKGQSSLMRTWSFHAVKNLPMGDGGGISTNDADLAKRLRRLRWMGIDKSTHARSQGRYVTEYDIIELGWKYHMNDITAAIGLATLPLARAQNERRRAIALAYSSAAISAGCEWEVEMPIWPHATHFLPLFFDNRAEIEAFCQQRGIGYSRHYRPTFLFRDFEHYDRPGEESALWYWNHALILPMFPGMTDEEIERVCEVITKGRFAYQP